MSAAQKSLKPQKLGIIAGGGHLPAMLVRACDEQGIEPFIIAFEGQTSPDLVRDHNHMWTRLGATGAVIKALNNHQIKDLVMIGSMHRPTLAELRPDLKTTEFFAKIALKALGDNDLLANIRTMLEEEGFALHGVHKFIDDLLTPEGIIGKHKPSKAQLIYIQRGIEAAEQLGMLDIGQSVIVQEGIILGVEAAEGTNELIKRCKHLKRKGRKGVLVKLCKPQQDHDLDLPTIGPETIELAIQNDLGGVAVHAGHSLMVGREDVICIANKHKLFVIGINSEEHADD